MKTKIFKISALMMVLASLFFYGCESDDDGGDGGSNSLYGVWVRTDGASGDETDIAIGGITGEPENRVYMCEYEGSVGLYKGYLNGSTISWDDNLPDAYVRMVGNQLEFSYPSVDYVIPTLYDRGSWSGNCGSLAGGGGGGGGSNTGKATFWTSSDLGCGNITVNVSGSSGVISQYYSSGTPDCGASGCANFTLAPGSYSFTASCSSGNWSGTIDVTADGCSKMRLY